MVTPAVSHWTSVRLPSCSRFRKPPCDPEQRDFPDSVLTLALLCKPFQPRRSLSAGTRTPRGRWFALQAGPYGGSSRLPVDQPCDRQAPRAPLPHVGVTLMGKTSCAFSKGITLSSSLIRTHAPSLYPPSDFRFSPYTKGLCRLLPAPCCVKALPNAIAVVLPCVPGPLLRLLPRCCLPFLPLGHWPSPYEQRVGAWRPYHLSYFGWRVLSELQSFHYVPAHRFVRLTGSSYPHTSQRPKEKCLSTGA